MCNLGVIFEEKNENNNDNNESEKYYERKSAELYESAAVLGDVVGMVNLGTCLSDGKGVEKDEKKAFNWFQKAANIDIFHHLYDNFNHHDMNGKRKAIYNLGVCYLKGVGAKEDKEKAKDMFREAANLGDPGAVLALGILE